ncbi:MAG: type IV pili methyl-accepting chemotaxis transducer N-terminal domain-containing protein, partial [Paracoccaceae bacterium]|nr:type IV pili methyl-accepting chemotaxis transducer N-terminal domain-containing protein [Paracoccaceae bacterium]
MLRLIISLAAVAALGPLAPAPAGADGISAAEDGARKINVSGRQRMLTQRMAKAVCFYRLGIEPERHREMALAAHELYDRSLAALIDGDPDMGLLPERNSRAEVQLRLAEELWADFGPAVKAALAEDDAAAAETVRATNVRLLEQSNKAVSALVIAHGSAEVAPDVAIAINVAGRQRMLSQRMSKEFCSLATGGAGEELRETLAETVALFEASHAGLVDGDPVLGV